LRIFVSFQVPENHTNAKYHHLGICPVEEESTLELVWGVNEPLQHYVVLVFQLVKVFRYVVIFVFPRDPGRETKDIIGTGLYLLRNIV
jgi:hypothetical protein